MELMPRSEGRSVTFGRKNVGVAIQLGQLKQNIISIPSTWKLEDPTSLLQSLPKCLRPGSASQHATPLTHHHNALAEVEELVLVLGVLELLLDVGERVAEDG